MEQNDYPTHDMRPQLYLTGSVQHCCNSKKKKNGLNASF